MLGRLRRWPTFAGSDFINFENMNILANISPNKCWLKGWVVCGDSQHLLRQHLLASIFSQHFTQQMLAVLLDRLRQTPTFVGQFFPTFEPTFVGFEI